MEASLAITMISNSTSKGLTGVVWWQLEIFWLNFLALPNLMRYSHLFIYYHLVI